VSSELVEYALRLGDDRLVLGHRLSEWCGHAPIVEEDIALANLALDCIGQASDFLGLAGELEGRGRDADALAFFRGPTEFRNALLVEQPNGDFAGTIARQVFFDAAGAPALAELARSKHPRLAAIAGKAAKEVRYHVRHARDWWLRLGGGTEESHGRLQRAVDELWPFTVELVTPDALDASLCAAGLGADLEAARLQFECGAPGSRRARASARPAVPAARRPPRRARRAPRPPSERDAVRRAGASGSPLVTHPEFEDLVVRFTDAFNRDDLDGVMSFFADDAVYDEFNGVRSQGSAAIRAAFAPQFAGAFGKIRFASEDLFVDPASGKALIRWLCTIERDGRVRGWRGLDILHVVDGRITEKLTYAKAERLALDEVAV
jgi:ring-1,2-phenylacetyl-CoA epoxidase subunit PaaC